MSFIDDYYIRPILEGTGYNPVNTLTYAVLLIIAVILTYKLLRRLRVVIDRRFFIGILPFIALGGILRSLEDLREATGLGKNVFLITPLIYVVIFVIALAALLIAVLIERRTQHAYHKTWFVLGLIVAAAGLSQMRVENAAGVVMMLGLAAAWGIVLVAAKIIAQKKFARVNAFLSFENIALLLIHLFDATTTFVAIEYFPYFEQHVVTGFFIDVLGTWSIFLLKFVVVSLVLWVFDRELKNEPKKRTFLKVVVAVLGLGPGLRNFLRLMMGV